MIDGPSAIDPLVAEGPREPVETLRPGLNLQRVLLLDEPGPMMVDLSTGDIRRYESGPPVSVPMVSDIFDLARLRQLQIQVIRDLRPSSVSQVLFAFDAVSAGVVIEVRITPNNVLELETIGEGANGLITADAGASPSFVIVLDHRAGNVALSVRNAETLDPTSTSVDVGEPGDGIVTIGGPSTRSTGRFGRRRGIPVLIELRHHEAPVDQLRAVARRARSLAGSARRRIG